MHVINQPMHVINQPMHVINQTMHVMSSTNPMHVMLSINQCMSCYQSTNACHVAGQALTVIIIVSQQNAVQEAPCVNLRETDSGTTSNFLFKLSGVEVEHLWAAQNMHTHSHVTQAVWGKLYSGLFFLYRFLKGHYERC